MDERTTLHPVTEAEQILDDRRRIPRSGPATEPDGPREPLWRNALGARLRELRRSRGETLAETAERAGISLQYLSEMERGLKEPSSEMIAAVAGALETTLAELTMAVAERLLVDRTLVQRASAAAPNRGGPRSGPVCSAGYALAA